MLISLDVNQGDISMFRRLTKNIDIPLMSEEGMVIEQNLWTLIEDGPVDYFNVKLMKNGGIYLVYKLASKAEIFDITRQIILVVESNIVSVAMFYVAFSNDNIISTENSEPTKFMKESSNCKLRFTNC